MYVYSNSAVLALMIDYMYVSEHMNTCILKLTVYSNRSKELQIVFLSDVIRIHYR